VARPENAEPDLWSNSSLMSIGRTPASNTVGQTALVIVKQKREILNFPKSLNRQGLSGFQKSESADVI
jgi:hypothetical protein